MTSLLERYHRLEARSLMGREVFIKPGVRGYPELPPGTEPMADAIPGTAGLVDASGTAGLVALASLAVAAGGSPDGRLAGDDGFGRAQAWPPERRALVLETSMAALRCAGRTLEGSGSELQPGLPWDVEPESARLLALAPPADRGSARVLAELAAGSRALTEGGALYLALHKDLGAKRYLRAAARLFGSTRVLSRQGGWRVVEAHDPTQPSDPPSWPGFDFEGLRIEALPGVHSAGRLDRGTALLLQSVPWAVLSGARLLDLGCGSGALALRAAVAGANVTAADDDLAAVRSCAHNAQANGLALEAVHSDIDSELGAREFDAVVCNPPFHVGKGVRLAVPQAFMAAAHRLLRPGGELWLVANRELPYERTLASWRSCERVADSAGFKVLRARR